MAQNLLFENLTTKDGLLTDEVYNLYQDKQGHIWIFSKYGTLKYNGLEFKSVLNNLSFNDRFIFCIYENKRGEKWVANSNAKIYLIRNDSAIKIKGIEEVSEKLRRAVSEIVQLVVDDSSNIFALTKGLSYKFQNKNSIYQPIDLSATIKNDTVLMKAFMIQDNLVYLPNHYLTDEFVFLGGSKRQSYLKLPNFEKPIKFNYKPFDPAFRRLKKLGKYYYFLIAKSICKIVNRDTINYIDIGSWVLNYSMDKNRHLWVGTFNDGLYEINEKDSIIAHYLPNVTVNDVLIDHQNGIWASTTGSGIFHCKNGNVSQFKREDKLGGSISVIKKLNDKLFIGTSRGDIFIIEESNLRLIRNGNNEGLLDIEAVDDHYIITMNYKIEKLDLVHHPHIKVINDKSEKYYNVISKSKDTVIYVWRRGLSYNVCGKVVKRIDYDFKIQSSQLIQNKLWIGTDFGLYVTESDFKVPSSVYSNTLIPDKVSLKMDSELSNLKNCSISNIKCDKSGRIWICTLSDGLFVVRNDKLFKISKNNLPSEIINDITFGEQNDIFLATNKGLFFTNSINSNYEKVEWKNIFDGEVHKCVLFNKKVYLSTNNGLIILDYNPSLNTNQIFFNCSSIIVDDHELAQNQFNQINDKLNKIEFKFEEIDFNNRQSKLKYYLKGASGDSGIVNNNSINFTNLLPGKYELTVYPLRPGFKNLTLTIPFNVKPEFWQTWYFKLAMIISILFILISIFWLIVKVQRKKEEIKNKNEQMIAEYKLIALKAQINPHFISNCLSSIQNLINKDNTNQANYYLSQFGLLVRNILDFSSQSVISLEDELNILNIYINLEKFRFKNQFQYLLEVEDELNLKSLFVPPLILNPIVENAIWHGLLPKQNKTDCSLEIKIKKMQNILKVVIIDNGVGRSYHNKENISERKSYGINITEQRLFNMNYLFKSKEANIIYNDLFDANNNPSGTSVELFIPLIINPKSHAKD